jgi:glycerol uptake facilitator-like aquaporin
VKKFRKYKSEIIIFAVTFVVLGLLIAIPLVFLQGSFLRFIIYQIIGAIAFTAITVFQIHKHYKKPLEQFRKPPEKLQTVTSPYSFRCGTEATV